MAAHRPGVSKVGTGWVRGYTEVCSIHTAGTGDLLKGRVDKDIAGRNLAVYM